MDTRTQDPPQEPRRWIRWAAIAVGLGFLVRSVLYLYRAHPHDDAYILFGYVRRFVAGEGIVFYPGGEHAEGATDFLWFAALSALHRLGIDVALAACLLNAAGGVLLGAVLARPIARSRALLVGLLVPAAFAGGAIAAIAGFGSLFFSAAAAWALFLAIQATEGGPRAGSAVLAIPLASLLLGLIRPDGLVLGAGFVLVAVVASRKQGLSRPFALRCLVAAAIGAAYFAWRWSYFGLPLPLPLYVKGHAAGELAGAASVRGWFFFLGGGWPLALALVLLLALGGRDQARNPRASTLAIAAAPFLAHLAVLSLARQSQNAAFRFEAPAQTALLYLLALAAARAMESRSAPGARWLVAAIALAGVLPGVLAGMKLLGEFEDLRTYVDVFGPRLGAILQPEDKVALGDQAGRIPYWSRAKLYDLVGLNTTRTALAPPDEAYLAEIDPDMCLLYLGPVAFDLPQGAGDVFPLEPGALERSVHAEFRDMFDHGIGEYGGASVPDSACNVIAAGFLVHSGRYDLYAVRYMDAFKHVIALKRGFPRAPAILEALRASVRPENYRSYARVAGLPFAP